MLPFWEENLEGAGWGTRISGQEGRWGGGAEPCRQVVFREGCAGWGVAFSVAHENIRERQNRGGKEVAVEDGPKRPLALHHRCCSTVSLYSHSCQHWKSCSSAHICLPCLPFCIAVARSRVSLWGCRVRKQQNVEDSLKPWTETVDFFPFPFLSPTGHICHNLTNWPYKSQHKTPEKPPCLYFPAIKTWVSCYFCVVCDEAGTCESSAFSHRAFCGSVQGGEEDAAAVSCWSGSPSRPGVARSVCPAGTALLLRCLVLYLLPF